jgi:hypothetical protein
MKEGEKRQKLRLSKKQREEREWNENPILKLIEEILEDEERLALDREGLHENSIESAVAELPDEEREETRKMLHKRARRVSKYARADKFEETIRRLDRARKLSIDKHNDLWRMSKEKKRNPYPIGWMKKDKEIAPLFKEHKFLAKILNFLYVLNRYLTNDEFKKMLQLTESIAEGKKHKRPKEITNSKTGEKEVIEVDFHHSVLYADKEFYQNMKKTVGCSEIWIKRYFRAFREVGILEELGRDWSNVRLYSDGYFVVYEDKNGVEHRSKRMFLRYSPQYRDALRALRSLI